MILLPEQGYKSCMENQFTSRSFLPCVESIRISNESSLRGNYKAYLGLEIGSTLYAFYDDGKAVPMPKIDLIIFQCALVQIQHELRI